MDDDIHFRNEERKKKTGLGGGVVVVKGGRKSSRGGEEGGRKKCFAWLQSKRAEEGGVFFRLRLAAAVTDGCVCERVCGCECLCACARCRGAHPSAFPGDAGGRGRRPLWLVKKQPAVLKQYQLRGNRQGDQSTTQSNKGKKNNKKRNKV